MINQTQVNDFKAGQKAKKAGYYDKWYRYNRKDDGAAYDDKENGIQIIEYKQF